MTGRSLRVVYGGDTAAVISEHASGSLSVEYADRPFPVPLSLSLPIGARHSGTLVANWLAGIVPDSERLSRYWAAVSGARGILPFDLLATKLGWDSPGSFQFVASDLEDEYALRRAAAQEAISRGKAGRWLSQIISACDDGTPFESGGVGAFSLAGARAKIGLRCEPGGLWQTTDGDLPTTHILKAGHPKIPSHAAIEHMCQTAAALCGLRASRTEFCDLDGTESVLVERWDRADNSGYRRARVWAEDLCQAAGLAPGEKEELRRRGPARQSSDGSALRLMHSTRVVHNR